MIGTIAGGMKKNSEDCGRSYGNERQEFGFCEDI